MIRLKNASKLKIEKKKLTEKVTSWTVFDSLMKLDYIYCAKIPKNTGL